MLQLEKRFPEAPFCYIHDPELNDPLPEYRIIISLTCYEIEHDGCDRARICFYRDDVDCSIKAIILSILDEIDFGTISHESNLD